MQSNDLSGFILIGAGSRDGDRLALMGEAVRRLAAEGLRAVRLSSLYETEPVALEGGRPLLNGAILASPLGSEASEILEACLRVEREMGRQRRRGHVCPKSGRAVGPAQSAAGPDLGSRPIDLDLLLFGNLVIASPGLTVPHPRMHLRRFVLVPAAEVAPSMRHPSLGGTMAALLAACRDPAWVRPFAPAAAWERAAALQ